MKRSTKKRHSRRDRRLAKLTNWKRQPKGKQVGHGTSLTDHVHDGRRVEPPEAVTKIPVVNVYPIPQEVIQELKELADEHS